MPLDQYKEQLHLDRFIPSSLADVTYNGSVYGIPWRMDVRPMLYRTDLIAQAGLPGPPDTWEDLVTYGKKLTVKGADGRMVIAGIVFHMGVNNNSQDFLHWMWQGGGEAMTMDAKTSTLNTKEVIDAMQFVRDLVYKHEVVSQDVLDPSYDGMSLFGSGKAALMPHGTAINSQILPELLPNIKPAIPTKGIRRTAYSGAGYFGLLRGTTKVEESLKLLEFLGRDENMLKLAKMQGESTTSIAAAKDDYFTKDEWRLEVLKCLEFAHTSQSPSPVWGQIAGTGPGSPIYDFWAGTLLNKEPISDLAQKANAKAQELIDRAQ
jgi:multiple sugar transport system substrate-binding protein